MKALATFVVGLLAVSSPGLHAAPLQADLGEGLRYYRIHDAPADLPPTETKPGPAVLDLRYAKGDASAAVALDAWLKFRAAPSHPVLVLVNEETASALQRAVAMDHDSLAGLLVIGADAKGVHPDITVNISAELERHAYDAFEHDTPITSLISEDPGKVRHDEASIAAKSHDPANDEDPEAIGDLSDAPAPSDKDTAKTPATPPRLTDRVLQRAVHVHRALKALNRL